MTISKENDFEVGLDVLIIGGGIQGIWMLKLLTEQGYSCVLLESGELCGGQTGHAHGGIHQGFMFGKREDLALALADRHLHSRWAPVLEEVQKGGSPWYYGFKSLVDAEMQYGLWNAIRREELSRTQNIGGQLRIPWRVPVPPVLDGSEIILTYQSEELCIEPCDVIRAIAEKMSRPNIFKTDGHFRFGIERDRLTQVEVNVGLSSVVFKPNATVLAAGRTNVDLLHQIGPAAVLNRNACNPWHMLVIRDPQGRLDALTGYFHRQFFLASRRTSDGATIWLLNDSAQRGSDRVAARALYSKWRSVVATDIVPESFEWGVYDAPAAELENEELPMHSPISATSHSGLPKALWAVWPNKMTLAPTQAEAVLAQLPSPARRPTEAGQRRLESLRRAASPSRATEKWVGTRLRRWLDFSEWIFSLTI
jgi:hypothetical protein